MTEKIEVPAHSCIRIKGDSVTLYADPFQLPSALRDGDIILVTHDHYDHFSPEDIAKAAKKSAILVVPERMKGKAKEAGQMVSEIVTMTAGESREIGGIRISAVPAYNIGKAFHSKSAGWVGYVVEVDGKRIYIAGDTDATPEARAVKCDIALVPIGGTYTMNPEEAAELINEMKPETVIPTHYGSIVGSKQDGKRFASMVKPPVKVELKLY